MGFMGDLGSGIQDAAGPVAGATIPVYGGIVGAGTSGGIPGMSEKIAGMDPTRVGQSNFQANPAISNFQAQNPMQPNFASALGWSQDNANNANMAFQQGPGGAPSFVQGLTQNYQNAQGQQQNLMNNLQQQTMGQGPGAQLSRNFLNQAQDTNAANAMGLMASQKGINPAMAARMAGNNAQMGNQAAAGQAANLGLQQQLAAQSQLGGMLGQNQALNANTFGQLSGMANQNNIAMQGLGANTNLETQRLNQLTQSQNAANQMGAQGINAETANANTAAKAKTQGGILGGLGSIGAAAIALAGGGRVPDCYNGGGKVDVVLSPDEIKIPRHIAQDRDKALAFIDSELGKVKGQAKFSGDDVKNDTVKTQATPGDVIVPRTAAKDKDKAKMFLDALRSGDSIWKGKKK